MRDLLPFIALFVCVSLPVGLLTYAVMRLAQSIRELAVASYDNDDDDDDDPADAWKTE